MTGADDTGNGSARRRLKRPGVMVLRRVNSLTIAV